MANISTYLQNSWLNTQRNVAFTALANVYFGLFSVAPTMPAGTGGTELTSGTAPGYARIAVPAASLSAASGGVLQNGTAITMAAASGTWPTAVAWGLWDALTAGNLLWAGTLVGQNDVQSLPLIGTGLSGTYTINYGGFGNTAAIPETATAAQVQEFLEEVTGIGAGNIQVTGATYSATGGTYTVTAIGALANASQTLATVNTAGLTGVVTSFTPSKTTNGSSGSKTLGNTDVFSLPINALTLSIA
jgi:hypothetical protein